MNKMELPLKELLLQNNTSLDSVGSSYHPKGSRLVTGLTLTDHPFAVEKRRHKPVTVTEAARLLANRRKHPGRKPVPRFRCLQCNALLSASSVRKHKCEKGKS